MLRLVYTRALPGLGRTPALAELVCLFVGLVILVDHVDRDGLRTGTGYADCAAQLDVFCRFLILTPTPHHPIPLVELCSLPYVYCAADGRDFQSSLCGPGC